MGRTEFPPAKKGEERKYGSLFVADRYVIDRTTGVPIKTGITSFYADTLTNAPIPNDCSSSATCRCSIPRFPPKTPTRTVSTMKTNGAGPTSRLPARNPPTRITRIRIPTTTQSCSSSSSSASPSACFSTPTTAIQRRTNPTSSSSRSTRSTSGSRASFSRSGQP